MTSLTKKTSTLFDDSQLIHFVSGPLYTGTGGGKILFPFTFKNSVLDINPINGFDLTGGNKPSFVGTGTGGLVKLQGGLNLVQQIGPNFVTYLKNCTWTDNTNDYSSLTNISVYKPGVVTRVQQLDDSSNLPEYINPPFDILNNGYVISMNAPEEGFNSTSLTNYGVTYVFKKPLVISATATANPQNADPDFTTTIYLTFFTSWDH
jgi:hypothetical protein